MVRHLYNLVISSCVIPESWKQALVVPLVKDGDRFSAANYRPIPMLPQIVKCFEKILHSMILEHIVFPHHLAMAFISEIRLTSSSFIHAWNTSMESKQ